MKRKKIISGFIAVLILCAIPLKAYAWTYLSMGYQNPYFSINLTNLNSTWSIPASRAASAWTMTPTRANISLSSSTTSNMVYGGNYAADWYGEYKALNYNVFGAATKFQITLNATSINSDASNFSNFVQSTVCHELGHALKLGDLSLASNCIMGYNRNRNTMITPQQDDINGVNSIWTNN